MDVFRVGKGVALVKMDVFQVGIGVALVKMGVFHAEKAWHDI